MSQPGKVTKILVANRGEIAVRVMRTAREMGIRSVAVYSDADARAMHTAMADEAVALGGNEPGESYLRVDRILDAARATGADAIHPGYGFLSERSEFAAQCREAGITFLGPSPEAMQALGGKIEAKQIAVRAGVPVTPGFFEPGATQAQLIEAAHRIGFPVMLKASAGGGGRGMRVVEFPEALEPMLNLASEEAKNAFGDGAMMVEKLVQRPRHIEVQIVADFHGNVAPLFERECSIQRRHQKLIEESPSPYFGWDHPMWAKMRDAAVRLIHEAGYVGAGTVEFIVEPASGEFYFLEVNARLQVEHPVTEGVTGLDLVRLQIEVARGANLKDLIPEFLEGNRTQMRTHCIEVRIVAEDPAQGFMPSIGKVLAWAEPRIPGVRVDTGFATGSEVTRFYDSLLAKVIVQGSDREIALNKLDAALRDFHILGVKTNIPFLLEVLRDPEFRKGEMDTGFLGRRFADWKPNAVVPGELGGLIDLATSVPASGAAPSAGVGAPRVDPCWSMTDRWRIARVGKS